MTKLIGLTGKRGAGKNTAAEFMAQWAYDNGKDAQLQGFADRLKLSFFRLFKPDATVEEAIQFCDHFKNSGELTIGAALHGELINHVEPRISGRVALQRYGTEAHREVFGIDFWVDQLLPIHGHALKWNQDIDYAIITDVRFDDEAQRVRDLGGEVWEIMRPSLEDQEDGHASESGVSEDHLTKIIVNAGDLDDLRILMQMALGDNSETLTIEDLYPLQTLDT